MFGSLVIIFPTHHEGGTLVLRDGGKEWTIDAASEMRSKSHPCVTYIAFYGDVEHEVLPITAGYRVTVTYNLYFNSTLVPLYSKIVDASYQQLKHTFEEMLTDSDTLPDGGYPGFGLRHRYGLTHSTKLDALLFSTSIAERLEVSIYRDIHDNFMNFNIECIALHSISYWSMCRVLATQLQGVYRKSAYGHQ